MTPAITAKILDVIKGLTKKREYELTKMGS